jgi:hypothetical protein
VTTDGSVDASLMRSILSAGPCDHRKEIGPP